MKLSLPRAIRRILDSPGDPRAELLKKMPRNAVCAEIGVWKGEFSDRIYATTAPAEFHLIDPWSFQPEFPDRMYGGKVAKQQHDMDAIHDAVKARLGAKPGVTMRRETSQVALPKFADGYFDWLYIDGNHEYDYVRKDVELAFLKVKPGGFIAGDDYDWGAKAAHAYPVRRAVADVMKALAVDASRLEIIGDQFVIAKPGSPNASSR